MHLIELIQELEAAKVARGNVKLVDVVVMASGDQKPIVDFADRAAARSNAPARQVIDVTGMAEDQIEELKAENPDAEFRAFPPVPSNAPGEQCNIVSVDKGACKLEIGHAGDHEWENPDGALDPAAQQAKAAFEAEQLAAEKLAAENAGKNIGIVPEDRGGAVVVEEKPATTADLAKVMGDAADKLDGPDDEGDAHTGATKMPDGKTNRCGAWDGHGHQCGLPAGHEDDHVFAGKQTDSAAGDAGLPAEVQQPDTLQE